MEEIVELKTMKAIEIYTQKKKRISEVTLIDHVAKALFDKIKDHVHKEATGVCFSGLGNNGADASKLTDYLVASGYNIKLVIVGNQTALSASHASILSQIKCAYYWSLDTFLPQEMIDLINRADYVIDGLFGTGLNKSIKGIYKTLIDTINQKNKTVYSIDIPSGLNAHNGIVKELAIKASITFGIGFAKFGYYLNDGLDYVGKLIMVDVGMVSTLEHKKYQVIEQKIPKDYLDRNHNSHKYHYGNLALFGGSHGLMGALHLSALSAYKLGAGLVHTYTLKKYLPYYTQHNLEVLNHFYERNPIGDLEKIDAIAFGMGLGKKDHHTRRLKDLLALNKPILIDADGLNYFDPSTAHPFTIITPHVGEFLRLTNFNKTDFSDNPIKHIKAFMNDFKGILVLKGPATIIAQGEALYIMPYGDATLAKAGSGDVLTGLILSLVGQHIDLLQATLHATLIHAKACQLAKHDLTTLSVLATDIIDYIPKAIMTLVKEKV